ncbi:MAG TPA: protein kinase [Pyrinomonadaceae bacterium]|jgi:predicted ATPase/serine/threonine protein kinase|nr:protein kinase [Pyrinomonadaceae bacterium]
MTPERWQRIKELFHRAVEMGAAERGAFLEAECAGDAELRAEVESLVAADARDGDFFGAAAGVAAQVVEGGGELEAGRRVGSYRVLGTLGEGGMGKVYLAADERLVRRVALKLLPQSFVVDAERVRRFEQEARAASALNHPNILTIHEIGDDAGLRFIATEFVEGLTLREHLRQGPLRLTEVLELGIQLAAALGAAHAARVVHRDVKPENVMVRPDGYVKVLDFGLAKPAREEAASGLASNDSGERARSLVSTHPGMIMGTVRYMSPEQARGLEVDERTDVWSLGVVLYECVAGRAPFEGPTNSDVLASVLNREPAPLARDASEVPAELERIVTKALAKDREERYQTAKDLGIDLRRLKQRLEFEAEMSRGRTQTSTATETAPQTDETHAAQSSSNMTATRAPSEQIKQVTILFADVGGLAAVTEALDAEELGELMDALWRRIDAAVMDSGGRVDRRMGEQLMALWGERVAHEDDPAHAVRAALRVRREVAEFVAENLNESNSDGEACEFVRAGVNTGAVLLSAAGAAGELTATGAAVHVAQRLGQSAPAGGVLISHDTYHHVRGLFDVRETELASVRGVGEPVRAYFVEREKPRAFRLRARGVEGVETRMVGRQAELSRMRDTLQTVVEDRELQVLTIVGDAGLGKSRLLDEFSSEVELLAAPAVVFNGRASQWARGLPFALVRDVFSLRFGIQDSDEPRVARAKFEQGMLEALGDDEEALMRAHFVGHLTGLDFSSSPHLAGILHDAKQVRGRAFHYAAEFFRRVAQRRPALLILDDLHWADDGSLDFIHHLARECASCPLLVVCTTRPDLLERRPEWGEGLHTHARLALQPLTRRESRQLVEEILRHAQAIPHALRELVVSAAEGNPFYVEELIKMLIDQKVIVASADRWHVDASRLVEVRVPPTLTGVLQARLDGLTAWEKTVLQRASVIGREFWDGALERFSRAAVERGRSAEEGDTAAALDALRRKELVYRREVSGFTGAREYVFKHALLRSVAYENVLKRERRRLHREAAAWLIGQSGGRVEEYAAVIAEHFELSKETARAAEWFGRASRQARASYAPEAAIGFYRKALEHLRALSETDEGVASLRAQTIGWYAGLGEVLTMQARYVEAAQAYESMREAAEARGDLIAQARAWNGLTAVQEYQGDNRAALKSARRAEELARAAGAGVKTKTETDESKAEEGSEAKSESEEAKSQLAVALNRQGLASHRLGDASAVERLGEQLLALSEEMSADSRSARANGLKLLGVAHEVSGRFEEAQECFERSLQLLKELGDRRNFGFMLNNLGVIAHLRADYATAVRRYEEALAIFREIGERTWELPTLGNLAGAQIGLEDYAAAEANLRQAIALTGPAGHFALSMIYCYLAESFWGQGVFEDALETALKALELGQRTENQDYIANAWRTLGLVASSRGGRISAGGSEHDAASCFGESLRVYTSMGAAAERARTLRDWSRHERASGNSEAASSMRREALEIFTGLGLTRELERLSREDAEA